MFSRRFIHLLKYSIRPILSIDGTYLYGKYKSMLMIAMDYDGNNQLFPLEFAITE